MATPTRDTIIHYLRLSGIKVPDTVDIEIRPGGFTAYWLQTEWPYEARRESYRYADIGLYWPQE